MSIAKQTQNNHLSNAVAIIGGILLMVSSPAFAHHAMDGTTPQTFIQGFISGIAHPVIGLDHLAFLVVAVLLAFTLKGMPRYLVPVAFVAATVGGTALHLGEANIPMSETLVALTVLIGAVLALTRKNLGAMVLGVVFAISGVFHGYAYGESIVGAEATPLLAYLVGFAVIQYALIAGGALGLEKVTKHSEKARALTAQVGSIGAFLAGGLFFMQSIS